MDRNLKLYFWYRIGSSFLAWMPVFFLYFNELLSLQEVLLLEAVYYIAVVLFELPSGYFSDRVGRKKTLMLSSFFLVLAIILFPLANGFVLLSAAQILFAAHMAFQSGTNTVFHFECLQALGREEEYGEREASINKYSMIALSVAALVGGLLAFIDLRLAFVVSLIGAVPALLMAMQFQTIPSTVEQKKESSFALQLLELFEYFKVKQLAWVSIVWVVLYALVHVPYEFYQPYVKLLKLEQYSTLASPTIVSGILFALTGFVAAFVAGESIRLQKLFGLKNLLIISLFVMVFIIGLLAYFLHPVLLVLILFRNAPSAAIRAPYNAYVTPQIQEKYRATFYSLMSLAGRLSFFGILFGLSFIADSEKTTDWESLSLLLGTVFMGGLFVALCSFFVALGLDLQITSKNDEQGI